MKIKMLQTIPGALNNGLNVYLFKKGLVYPNAEVEDLEGLDEIFLDNGFAEIHQEPEEVIRHQKGLTGAPENKRAQAPEDIVDEYEEAVVFTYNELEGKKAGEIRDLAKKFGVDLSDFHMRTSAEKLIEAYLERQ